MPEYIQTSFENGVARLTLNRPEKRNALKRDFIEEMKAAIDEFAASESLRAFVLAANGSVFCAGMDLGEMQQRAQSEDGKREWQRDSEVYAEVLARIYSLDVPTVALVQGPALAGGMGMVLACDIVIASQNVFFMLPEPMRGITASMVTPFLIHRIGSGPASFILLSGERVSADRAALFGLCHDVVKPGELDSRGEALIGAILSGSKSALAITKRHIKKCTAEQVLDDLKTSISVSAEARETDDAREGLAAFLEKRKPNWQPE
jgi:methylglutaconyl-CoA hydratase